MTNRLNNPTRDEIWMTIRRGVENGAIRNHKEATKAVIALRAAFSVIYSDHFAELLAEEESDRRHQESPSQSIS